MMTCTDVVLFMSELNKDLGIYPHCLGYFEGVAVALYIERQEYCDVHFEQDVFYSDGFALGFLHIVNSCENSRKWEVWLKQALMPKELVVLMKKYAEVVWA